MILEALRNFGGGFEPPQTSPRYATDINTAIVRTSEVAITTTLSLNQAGCDYVHLAPGADHGSVGPEVYTILGALFLSKRIQNYKTQI